MTTAFPGKDVQQYVSDYIKFGDTKAGAVLTLATAVLGAIASVSDHVFAQAHLLPPRFQLFAALTAASLVLASTLVIWYAISALSPRTTQVGHSLLSFPDIARMSSDDYVRECAAITEAELAAQYARFNVTLSAIAATKFRLLGNAAAWLRIQLLVAALFLVTAEIANFVRLT